MIVYTNWFIPSNFSAMTYGPIIFVRPGKKGDEALIAHEKVHVKQFWKNPFFGLAYKFSKKSRLKYELEAYREQLKLVPDRIDAFALSLSTEYDLDITRQEAKRMLNGDQ